MFLKVYDGVQWAPHLERKFGWMNGMDLSPGQPVGGTAFMRKRRSEDTDVEKLLILIYSESDSDNDSDTPIRQWNAQQFLQVYQQQLAISLWVSHLSSLFEISYIYKFHYAWISIASSGESFLSF